MSKPLSKPKIEALTGLRFFASIAAVISNMSLWPDVDPGFARLINWGPLKGIITTPFRVDIFFMLSGFLLIYIYAEHFQKNMSFLKSIKFYALRLARIYPLHLFSLLLILALNLIGIWKPGSMYAPGQFSAERIYEEGAYLANFTLTSAWSVFKYKLSWNGPAWSLSAEWFNYLLFPLIALSFSFIKKTSHHFFTFFTVLFIYLILVEGSHHTYYADHGTGALIRSVIGFYIGGVCASLYQKKFLENINWDHVFTATFWMFLNFLVFYGITKRPNFIFIYMMLPILIFSLAKTKTYVRAALSQPFVIYLGKLSFGIYMLHQPVLRVMGHILKGVYKKISIEPNQMTLHFHLLFCLITIVFCASLTFHLIEDPIRKILRRKLKV
jgi:peptidoglycan/LPS O-acetylase OafA/YrhL